MGEANKRLILKNSFLLIMTLESHASSDISFHQIRMVSKKY